MFTGNPPARNTVPLNLLMHSFYHHFTSIYYSQSTPYCSSFPRYPKTKIALKYLDISLLFICSSIIRRHSFWASKLFSLIIRRPPKVSKKLSGVVSKPVRIPGSNCIFTILRAKCSPLGMHPRRFRSQCRYSDR